MTVRTAAWLLALLLTASGAAHLISANQEHDGIWAWCEHDRGIMMNARDIARLVRDRCSAR